MEDSKKKPVMIGVIVACLAVAAVIFIKTSSQDSASTNLKGQKIWLKCTDKACGAEYQMELQKYRDLIAKKGSMMSMRAPRCFGSAAICSVVSAAAFMSRS